LIRTALRALHRDRVNSALLAVAGANRSVALLDKERAYRCH